MIIAVIILTIAVNEWEVLEKALPTIGSLKLMHDLVNLSLCLTQLSVDIANAESLSGSLGARLPLNIVWSIFLLSLPTRSIYICGQQTMQTGGYTTSTI